MMGLGARILFFALWIVVNLVEIKCQDSVRQCWNLEGQKSTNPYYIGNGFTCCNNILLDHPIRPKSEHWRKCMSKQHGNYEDDLPLTMWNIYMCEMASAGSFKVETLTYKIFQFFFMKNYPKIIQDRILTKDVVCDVPNDANLTTKLQAYENCFLIAEEDMCVNSAGKSAQATQPNKTSTGVKPAANMRICEPVKSLKNPNHSFITFAQPCCKGQELPYPLFDVFMDFDRFDVAQNVVMCTEKYKSRLKELNYTKEMEEILTMCQVACVHEVDGLKRKYNSNFQDLLNFKMKSLSNSTKETMMSTITRYKPTFQLYKSKDSNSIPMDQAGEAIAKLDEGGQILNYCKFQYEATAEAYRSLYEYCYNAEYGSQFREDILKSANRKTK